MTFVSFDFLIFLVFVVSLFHLSPQKLRTPLLVVASYFFYGYWSIGFLGLLIGTITLDYFVALSISRVQTKRNRKWLLAFSLLSNLGTLFFFKYLGLFSKTLAYLTATEPLSWDIVLPFGISFYTFHALSYVIDVYRGKFPAEKRFLNYSAYVMFFPQLVAGPIARAEQLLPQFSRRTQLTHQKFLKGAYLVGRGLFLKVVLSERLASFSQGIYSDYPFVVVQSVYFFAFLIYFDFSGYTDIARGIAKWFDYDLTINFLRPYAAESIADFWRRWHISLSTWLKDYLYIPLGGNRAGNFATYRNLFLTMLIGGLWHGANWTFAIWGALHGVFLTVERALAKHGGTKFYRVFPRWLKTGITFHLVTFAWIFFRADNFSHAIFIFKKGVEWLANPTFFFARQLQVYLWLACLGWLVFVRVEERWDLQTRFASAPILLRATIAYAMIAVLFLFCETQSTPFIYFQF